MEQTTLQTGADKRISFIPPIGFEDLKAEISEEHKELNKLLERDRILLSDNYEQSPVAISIINNGEVSTFGTLGNFSLVKGKAKSKKTFLMCLMLAASISKKPGMIKSELPENKRRVILFDTEQSRFHVLQRLKAINKLAQGASDNIEVYSLRGNIPSERLKEIEFRLTEKNHNNDIGLVVIDGIRDLIHDINDPKEATLIATKLLQWTALTNCHIITVLHENKGDNHARGHVGTELVNKAETVVSVIVDKDKDVSIVEAEFTREKDFPNFYFKIIDGLPVVVEDYDPNPAFTPASISDEKHREKLKTVFIKPELTREELEEEIKKVWVVGKTYSEQTIKYYTGKGWIKNLNGKGMISKYILTFPT